MIPTAAPTGSRDPAGDEATITPRRANHDPSWQGQQRATLLLSRHTHTAWHEDWREEEARQSAHGLTKQAPSPHVPEWQTHAKLNDLAALDAITTAVTLSLAQLGV